MRVYYNKIKELRKIKKITIAEFCSNLSIARATYWNWESGKNMPAEFRVKLMAKILNVKVNEISDLKPERELSKANLSESVESWLLLGGNYERQRIEQQNKFIKMVKQLHHELGQASTLTRVIMTSTNAMLYIKDNNLDYIIANNAFLTNVSHEVHVSILGKEDKYFFNSKEASLNTEQDKEVLESGIALVNKEGYIPGSKNKLWGLISKYPILDSNGKMAGVFGTFVDITHKREQEKINELLKLSLDRGTDAIFLKNRQQNKYWYISRGTEILYGYPLETFYNDTKFWLNECLHPDFREKELEYQKFLNWPKIHKYKIITAYKEIKWIEERVYSGSNYTLKIERDISSIIDNETKNIELVKLNIVEKLLNENIDINIISRSFNLSIAEIEGYIYRK
ncbi:MAG TPA: PAS domain-containing protein [Victivallales bacterium]|nr:PAS domain-containing protein [Victivallales bacterium]